MRGWSVTSTRAADLPASFAQIVEDFHALGERDRLQLLLEFSQDLPPLPERYAGEHEGMEAVPECQSPVFVKVELDGGGDEEVHVWFDAPPDGGGQDAGLDGLTAHQLLDVPDDVPGRLGLTEAVSPLRLRGMAGMLWRIKRQVRQELSEAGR